MVKAKKKFGQNFIKDENIKNKIIESIPNTVNRIVEIGAGLGDLTQKLVRLDSKIDCFEIDSDLFKILSDKFQTELNDGKLSITNCDVLANWDKISVSSYFLVANLPYYIATNIVLNAIDDPFCTGFVVMLQREVALKFSARENLNSLSILTQMKGDCELLFDVPNTAFDPVPKVVSSVIRVIKNRDLTLSIDYDQFKIFLRAAFAAPRKVLIKNLLNFVPREILESVFRTYDIPFTIRPHQLSLALYLKIFIEVKNEQRSIYNGKIQQEKKI